VRAKHTDLTQTTQDQDVQVFPPRRVTEGSTQTLPTSTRENVSQVPSAQTREDATSTEPLTTTADMGTAMDPKDTTTSWTQVR